MKQLTKWCFAFLLGLLCCLWVQEPVMAEIGGNDASYTYTVTLYAGNQGTFSSNRGISVDNHKTDSSYEISAPQENGEVIYVTGLEYGDIVMMNAQSCVSLKSNRYYVGGVRESGQDNSTVSKSAFQVDSDRDYVVAYGIRGNMVSYVVNYLDEAGNALLESDTYYGAVGDYPVIAFQYIEGYWPQSYNLTRRLSANEAENVFTFVYTPMYLYEDIEDTEEEEETETEIIYVEEEDEEQNQTDIQEENPQDLINLDEQDVPLAYQLMEKIAEFAKEKPLEFAGLSVLTLGLIVLLILFILFKRKKKKEEETEEEVESEAEKKE